MSRSIDTIGTASRTTRSVHLQRTVPADPATVWAAWTDPSVLPAWFGPVLSGAPGPGERYVLEGRGQHGDTIECAVRTWEPVRVLEHTWRYTGETVSVLRLELVDRGDGSTRMVIDHTGFGPEADPADYAAGWHMYTDRLESHLVGGPPPPDSDARWSELLPVYAAAAG